MTNDPHNATFAPNGEPDHHLTTADLAHGGEQHSAQDSAPLERATEIPVQRNEPGVHTGANTGADTGANTHTEPGSMHSGAENATASLFAPDEATQFRSRWTEVQAGFVDEPRRAVESADELVANTMKRLAEIFAHERTRLEEQWAKGGDVSTEDLRQALRRYRAFFDRLLSV